MKGPSRFLVVVLLAGCGLVVLTHLIRWRPAASSILLREIAVCGLVAGACLLLGSALLGRLRVASELGGLEYCVQAFAIGGGALMMVLALAGLAGVLSRRLVAATVVLALGVGLIRIRRLGSVLGRAATELSGEMSSPGLSALAMLMLFALALPMVIALMPAVFYDSLLYHLEAPSLWLQSGGLTTSPDNYFLAYPLNTSLLYMAALAFDHEASPALLHFFLLVASGFALICLGKTVGRGVGLLASALFVVTPAALETAAYPIADLGVAFWSLAAVLAWLRWYSREGSGWLAICGAELGLAVGCKYTAGLVIVLPLLLLTVVLSGTGKMRKRLGASALVCLCAALTFSPWAIRNASETGNPIYPYLFGAKQDYVANQSLRNEVEKRMPEGSGPGRFVLHLVEGPMLLLSSGQGVAAMVGPALFVGLPLLLLCRPITRRVKVLLAIAGCGFLFWDATVHLTRYALPFLALLAVASAWAMLRCGAGLRPFLVVVVGLGLAHNLLMSFMAFPWGDVREVLAGRMTRTEYTSKYVSYFDAVRWASSSLPQSSKVLFVGEARGYYARFPHVTRATTRQPLLVELARAGGGQVELSSRLREMGFTHLLLSSSEIERIAAMRGPAYLGNDNSAVRHSVQSFLSEGCEILFESRGVLIARIR